MRRSDSSTSPIRWLLTVVNIRNSRPQAPMWRKQPDDSHHPPLDLVTRDLSGSSREQPFTTVLRETVDLTTKNTNSDTQQPTLDSVDLSRTRYHQSRCLNLSFGLQRLFLTPRFGNAQVVLALSGNRPLLACPWRYVNSVLRRGTCGDSVCKTVSFLVARAGRPLHEDLQRLFFHVTCKFHEDRAHGYLVLISLNSAAPLPPLSVHVGAIVTLVLLSGPFCRRTRSARRLLLVPPT